MKILLIEDGKWLADSLAESLKREFSDDKLNTFFIQICRDPNDACSLIDVSRSDVILADWFLGAQNILTLLAELQSYLDTRTIPVVLMTAASGLNLDDLAEFGVKKIIEKAKMTPRILRENLLEATNSQSNLLCSSDFDNIVKNSGEFIGDSVLDSNVESPGDLKFEKVEQNDV
jgi:CheY-like chemotaxis protein